MHKSLLITLLLGIISATRSFYTLSEIQKDPGFVPGIATSFNLPVIMKAMNHCDVERAQVQGWNCFKGIYVVYKNGTVVPGIKGNLPDIAIYFKKCGDKVSEVVFVTKCIMPNPIPCVLPCSVPSTSSSVLPCSIPSTSSSVLPSCPETSPCLCPVEWCPADGFDPCKPECPKFSSKRSCCRCNSKRKLRRSLIVVKTFVFTKKEINGRNVRVLIVNKKAELNEKKTIILDGSTKLEIRILNHPRKLKCIKESMEKKFNGPVCIYVNDCSEIFILFDDCLYAVCERKNKIRKLTREERKEVIKKGLYSVIIQE